MFSTAKSLPAKPTAVKKPPRAQHEIKGLENLAKLKAMGELISSMTKTLEASIKVAGFAIFMDTKGSVRPSSFEALDGTATCSVEMRKRGVNSALSEEEVLVLRSENIEPAKQVITPKLFAINPAYMEDTALLAKIEKALTKLGVPEDLIVKQDEVSKFVVNDEMLDSAFKTTGTEAVLSIMTTMALRPKLSDEYDMLHLFGDVLEIMQPKRKTIKQLIHKRT